MTAAAAARVALELDLAARETVEHAQRDVADRARVDVATGLLMAT